MSNYGNSNGTAKKGMPVYAYLLAALILGICIIIAAGGVSKSVKMLNETVSQTKFDSQFMSPDKLTVTNITPKKYLTETEAAAYLNISEASVKSAITSGEIDEYITTDSGYSISIESLDRYFSQKAYEIQTKKNSEE